jgi:hypothetical protein
VKNTYYKRNYRPVTRASSTEPYSGMPATWIEEACFVGCGQGDAGAAR